ncbi:MAG: MBL fold metallo-hydrolase [Gemmatimonadota bacterium]
MPASTSPRTLWFALLASLVSLPLQGQDIKVTLLGSGCPPPVMNRFGPSTLVQAGGQALLIDAGRGALQRLTQIGVQWRDVTGVFLTHLHSDHVVGFPDLLMTGWLIAPGRTAPLPVWGPTGTEQMMYHLREAYQQDIHFRVANERMNPEGPVVQAKDIVAGVIYDRGGVKVTAFEVDHAPVRPAFGYRIDYGGRAVVVSGDTRVSENVIRFATGADVLIHEVLVPETLQRMGVPPDRAQSIIDYHTTPEQAGTVFARAKPRLAVYSHICTPSATDQELIVGTRRTYQGPLEVGEDLMVIDVGPEIAVRRPSERVQ